MVASAVCNSLTDSTGVSTECADLGGDKTAG